MENLPSDLCPGQAGCDTNLITLLLFVREELRRSQELIQVPRSDFCLLFLSLPTSA